MNTPRDRAKRFGQWYAPGEWNVWCQRCGRKIKSSAARKEWDGLWLCQECYDERQPQDLVRGVPDRQATSFSAPESPDAIIPLYDLPVTGLTLNTFTSGPEDLWDGVNTIQVQVSGGALASTTDLGVLNGANMCAVMNSASQWEIIQFVNATMTGVNTYALSRLLRARVGTEQAMYGTFPVNSPFVYLGQSSQAVYDQLQQYFSVDVFPFSPCYVSFYTDADGDLIIDWIRRSKIPRIDQDDFDPTLGDPVGEIDERYQVDILNSSGSVVRTLYVVGPPGVTYTYGAQIADFGAVQTSYTVNVYQVSLDQYTINEGRSSPRQATAIISQLQP
jgi:hypothetical protein